MSSEASSSSLSENEIDIKSVLDGIKKAVKEVKETKDYVSFSTIVDLYLSEPLKYTYSERELLLEELLNVLKTERDLTYEIGWDVPSLCMNYVELDFKFDDSIRQAPCVYKVLKIFECLALYGNAKELFLKSCELLSNLPDVTKEHEKEYQEKFNDIKIYCVAELINSSLAKVKTLYPSRFLSSVVSSFINSIHRLLSVSYGEEFIMRRSFIFARGYKPPARPSFDEVDMSFAEYDKTVEDEKFLQRKLLTAFVTQVIHLCGSQHANGYSIKLFSLIQKSSPGLSKKVMELDFDTTLTERFMELAYSFDIDLAGTFRKHIVDANILFHGFNFERPTDEVTSDLFEKVIVDYQTNVHNAIITNSMDKINDSMTGCLILYTHAVIRKRLFTKIELTFKDAILLTLRNLIPGMVNRTFISIQMADVCIFWSWFAVFKLRCAKKNFPLEVAVIPAPLLITYYQVLLYTCVEMPAAPTVRYVVLTLLTKILCSSPEETAYAFIKDSLWDCPFQNLKTVLVGILKELLTKEKLVSSLSNEMNELNLDKSDKGDTAPKKKNILQLTQERVKDIFDLINAELDITFVVPRGPLHGSDDANEDRKKKSLEISGAEFASFLAYLNLLVVIKDDPMVNFKHIDSLISKIEERLEIAAKFYESDGKGLNYLSMLRLTIDRIKA